MLKTVRQNYILIDTTCHVQRLGLSHGLCMKEGLLLCPTKQKGSNYAECRTEKNDFKVILLSSLSSCRLIIGHVAVLLLYISLFLVYINPHI